MSSTSSRQSVSDFWGVITETKRIINAHSRHFLALSVLFLLPLSFSLISFPTLFLTFTSPTPNHTLSSLNSLKFPNYQNTHHHQHFHFHQYDSDDYPPLNYQKTLTFTLLFTSFILLFSLLAIASITFSVFHGFYGRPVKIFTAITSLCRSFLPLLGTVMATQVVIFLILAIFGIISYVGTLAFTLVFGEFDYSSGYFKGLVVVVGVVILGVILLYASGTWCLSSVIVVVESKWGLEPLVRSKNLMRGMRWVGLSLMVFYGFFASVLLWISMVSGSGDLGLMRDGWKTSAFIARTVLCCAVLTLIMLHSIASSTVLYMYCKALHGELAGEIVNEFSAEYVSLPFDDKKLPHIVYYVQ